MQSPAKSYLKVSSKRCARRRTSHLLLRDDSGLAKNFAKSRQNVNNVARNESSTHLLVIIVANLPQWLHRLEAVESQ
jgi:hypothetical protein